MLLLNTLRERAATRGMGKSSPWDDRPVSSAPPPPKLMPRPQAGTGVISSSSPPALMQALGIAKPAGEPPTPKPDPRVPNPAAPPMPHQRQTLGMLASLRQRAMVKSEGLEKTSWNARMRRQYQFAPGGDQPRTMLVEQPTVPPSQVKEPLKLYPGQVRQRREQYARSVGLQPKYDAGATVNRTMAAGRGSAKGNLLPHGGQFGLEHEAAHAMMTPEGQTVNQYQRWLTQHKSPAATGDDYDDGFEPDLEHEEATHHENLANAIEPHFDRRAGVDPHAFASEFRENLVTPEDMGEGYDHYGGPDEGEPGYVLEHGNAKPVAHREAARDYVRQFDEGARFSRRGRIVPPGGVDAAVNQGGGLEALRLRARTRFQKKSDKPESAHDDAARQVEENRRRSLQSHHLNGFPTQGHVPDGTPAVPPRVTKKP